MNMSELRDRLYASFPMLNVCLDRTTAHLIRRQVDMRWYYNGVLPISVSGFNPLSGNVYYGSMSYFEDFIVRSNGELRGSLDWYLYEIFFALHDFMHVWSASFLLDLFPHCLDMEEGLGVDRISDIAFVLLMSEVAATCSVDFWMLCQLRMQDVLFADTKFRGVTTPFNVLDNLADARSISPKFDVATPDFFIWLADGYFNGAFRGFENASGIKDEKLRWLDKEMRVSLRQRQVLSRWVTYMHTGVSAPNPSIFELERPEYRNAMFRLRDELWKIFYGEDWQDLKKIPLVTVKFPKVSGELIDFRFINLLALKDFPSPKLVEALTERQFYYLANQYVSAHSWSDQVELDHGRFKSIVQSRDWLALQEIFSRVTQLKQEPQSLGHIFMPN